MNSLNKTREKILDVAEELFSEEGLNGVSIRDITTKARVNLGAINYHFGSKEALIAAVFERRIVPVNDARLAALDAIQRGRKGSPKVEEVMGAFIRPTVECFFGTAKGCQAFSKLFGRCLSEPSPEIENLLKRQFEPLVERLTAVLMKALPKLSRSDIFWRLKFTFGALHHWHLTKDNFLPAWLEKSDVEEQIQKLIGFSAAGFRAS